ncbi:cation transporter dimerization domain-containing protein, partial [Enterobacter hormaechei]
VDVHLEVLDQLSVVEGHEIAAAARRNVIDKHPVLDVMTHIDPVGPIVSGDMQGVPRAYKQA